MKAAAIFRFLLCWLVLFAISDLPAAHKKRRQLTAAEAVVASFEKMISSGALLTPNGWEKASKLFEETKAYPNDGEIRIVDPGMSGEWAQESIANVDCRVPCVVDSKWGSYYGSLDSKLRFRTPDGGGPVTTSTLYDLVRVENEWKIEGPLLIRSATLDGAIEYVTKKRDESSDPKIKKNATTTIAILKRLAKGPGKACAC